MEALEAHWSKTHTVPMEHSIQELTQIHPMLQALLGDKVNTPIKLYEEVPAPAEESS
jgi:hypothetical protein